MRSVQYAKISIALHINIIQLHEKIYISSSYNFYEQISLSIHEFHEHKHINLQTGSYQIPSFYKFQFCIY